MATFFGAQWPKAEVGFAEIIAKKTTASQLFSTTGLEEST